MTRRLGRLPRPPAAACRHAASPGDCVSIDPTCAGAGDGARADRSRACSRGSSGRRRPRPRPPRPPPGGGSRRPARCASSPRRGLGDSPAASTRPRSWRRRRRRRRPRRRGRRHPHGPGPAVTYGRPPATERSPPRPSWAPRRTTPCDARLRPSCPRRPRRPQGDDRRLRPRDLCGLQRLHELRPRRLRPHRATRTCHPCRRSRSRPEDRRLVIYVTAAGSTRTIRSPSRARAPNST